MTPQTTTLANGLRIVTAEMPAVYSASITVLVGVGSRHENFHLNGGVSHFLEHMLFKGSQKWPDWRVLSSTVDSLGGINNAYTSNDLTGFYIKVPSKHAELALEILSDMVRAPLFKHDEVERERGVMLEEMKVRRTEDPAQYIHELLPRALWPYDPLGQEVMGAEDVVNKIAREAIAEFYHQHYIASNIVVSVAGNVRHDRIVDLAKKFLGDMPRLPARPAVVLDSRLGSELTQSVIQDTKQAHLLIGAQAVSYTDRLNPAANVLANLLGGGMSSRLFLEVRERLGLAYHVYTDYQNYVDTGYLAAYAGVHLDKVDLAIEAILGEFDKVRLELMPADELLKVKNKMIGSLELAMENSILVSERYGTQSVLLGKPKTIEEAVREIEQVTAKDVRAVAATLLAKQRLRAAIIAPDPAPIEQVFTDLIKQGA